jgi:hypothetical protein
MSRLNAGLGPPQKEPLKTLVFESYDHGCSVTCNATGYKTPNARRELRLEAGATQERTL